MASRPMNDEEVLSEMNKMVCLARWLAHFHQPYLSLFDNQPGRFHQTGGTREGPRN